MPPRVSLQWRLRWISRDARGPKVDLFFNVTDLDVSDGHAYLNDDRVRIIGTFGASLLDLEIGVVADGSHRLGDVA